MTVTGSSDPRELEQTRQAVLEVAIEMDRAGLTEGTAGNISARTRAGEVVLTPTATQYAGMSIEDLVVTDLDGRIRSGERAPTTEIGLHLACLRRHPDIAAVVHTHPIYASMFAVNQQPIPCVVEEFEFQIGADVPVAPYHRTGTDALGEGVAALLEDRAAALLANHGLVVVASNPAEALQLTKLVERTARIVWGARAMGESQRLPDDVRRAFAEQYREHRKRSAKPRTA